MLEGEPDGELQIVPPLLPDEVVPMRTTSSVWDGRNSSPHPFSSRAWRLMALATSG